jgi:hypothetical protein
MQGSSWQYGASTSKAKSQHDYEKAAGRGVLAGEDCREQPGGALIPSDALNRIVNGISTGFT